MITIIIDYNQPLLSLTFVTDIIAHTGGPIVTLTIGPAVWTYYAL